MKTHSGLFSRICEYENLLQAHYDARRGKKFKPEVMRFHECAESGILRIQAELLSGTWTPSPYREFVKIGPTKRRIIHAPTYGDRVVHHAIARILLPLFERKWIYDSYACRKNKGAHAAASRLQVFLRRCEAQKPYVLQIDIAKYYPSINHGILLELLARTIRDNAVLDLLARLIYESSCAGKGIPIGAYTSQIFANIYLNEVDHFVKECMGKKWYLRYMDDMILLGEKSEAQNALKDIRWLIEGPLRLKINPKSKIFPASHGIDFCGYRTWKNHVRPRKRTVSAAKKRFQLLSKKYATGQVGIADVTPRVASFLGYMQRCQGTVTTRATLRRLVLKRPGG